MIEFGVEKQKVSGTVTNSIHLWAEILFLKPEELIYQNLSLVVESVF